MEHYLRKIYMGKCWQGRNYH